jgi:hypothetical protein
LRSLSASAAAARVVDLRLFYPRLKGPATVVPSLRAIDPGRDLSLGDTRRAFQCVIWNIEREIVLCEFYGTRALQHRIDALLIWFGSCSSGEKQNAF